MRRVAALERYGGQRLAAGDLENRPEQYRPPGHRAPMPRCKVFDFRAREIAVGRGEIEVEIHWVGHAGTPQTGDSFLVTRDSSSTDQTSNESRFSNDALQRDRGRFAAAYAQRGDAASGAVL